ncbi:hypothetical protein BTVI_105244 [Pitangus sulphuratus]|nr:hypothetical protein BTVI_105244 [Pitangus sulphuratus]
MIAELLSSALGLALYLNTLGADFCYDDRAPWYVFVQIPKQDKGLQEKTGMSVKEIDVLKLPLEGQSRPMMMINMAKAILIRKDTTKMRRIFYVSD